MKVEQHLIGYREVRISDIKLPDNWQDILDDPHTKDRATSIKDHGMIQEPVLRENDLRLICGRKRVGAAVLNGEERIMCKLIECDDDSAAILERIENLHRVHYSEPAQNKMTAELVELYARKINTVEYKGHGKPHSAKGEARKRLSKDLGVQQKSIRMREYRHQLALKNTKTEDRTVTSQGKLLPKNLDPKVSSKLPIMMLGMEIEDRDFAAAVKFTVEHLQEAAQYALAAQASLNKVIRAGLPFQGGMGRVGRERDKLREMGATLRGLKPYSVCPYCKGLEELSPTCEKCKGVVWVCRVDIEGVPQALLNDQRPSVLKNGELIPVDHFMPDEEGTRLEKRVLEETPEAFPEDDDSDPFDVGE